MYYFIFDVVLVPDLLCDIRARVSVLRRKMCANRFGSAVDEKKSPLTCFIYEIVTAAVMFSRRTSSVSLKRHSFTLPFAARYSWSEKKKNLSQKRKSFSFQFFFSPTAPVLLFVRGVLHSTDGNDIRRDSSPRTLSSSPCALPRAVFFSVRLGRPKIDRILFFCLCEFFHDYTSTASVIRRLPSETVPVPRGKRENQIRNDRILVFGCSILPF